MSAGRVAEKCAQCGRPVRGWIELHGKRIRLGHINYIDPDGRFCTLRCAARYGVAAERANSRYAVERARAS